MTNEIFERSERLQKLPPYIFAAIDKIKKQEIKKGRTLFTLGVGDPDMPAPQFVMDRLVEALKLPHAHNYPSYWGMIEFRKAVARWYERRFNVSLDPENEVLTLIGSKEGLAHIPLAFVNPGDATLVPDPSYPVYSIGTLFAGGVPIRFPLLEKNNFLPDLAELQKQVDQCNKNGQRVKILFLNYPNNPTAAVATIEFFEEVVAFAKKNQIMVCHDNAYSEVYFDGKKQPSFLQARGAREVGCEFHSLSKTFNMAGWRIGFVVGNRKIIEALADIKTNIDSGVFNACQEAAVEALDHYEPFAGDLRKMYQQRRDILLPGLQHAGLKSSSPDATFYIWSRLPQGITSADFVMRMILEKGVVAMPGNGFGEAGEGFVRFSLCMDALKLKQVAEVLKSSV